MAESVRATAIPTPVGQWWCNDYADGSVWPCEVITANIFGVFVMPKNPAPDADQTRYVPPSSVYDNAFNHPYRSA